MYAKNLMKDKKTFEKCFICLDQYLLIDKLLYKKILLLKYLLIIIISMCIMIFYIVFFLEWYITTYKILKNYLGIINKIINKIN